MVEFGGYSLHAGDIRPYILGWLDIMVFLLGHVRPGEICMVWAIGNCCYMHTLILGSPSKGHVLYTISNHIVCVNLCFILQLSRTSSLIHGDNLVLSGLRSLCIVRVGEVMVPHALRLHSRLLRQSHYRTMIFWQDEISQKVA